MITISLCTDVALFGFENLTAFIEGRMTNVCVSIQNDGQVTVPTNISIILKYSESGMTIDIVYINCCS